MVKIIFITLTWCTRIAWIILGLMIFFGEGFYACQKLGFWTALIFTVFLGPIFYPLFPIYSFFVYKSTFLVILVYGGGIISILLGYLSDYFAHLAKGKSTSVSKETLELLAKFEDQQII